VNQISRGAYVLCEAPGAKAAIIATGSELQLAVAAHQALLQQGIPTRVISMPCSNVFDRQSQDYQDAVLPMAMPAVAIEAAHPDFWRKYVGRSGKVVGISTFGESAPAPILYEHFGITAQAVEQAVQAVVGA
jgi:transketolase